MKQNKIILIVDDDIDLLENTAFLINSAGYDVVTAQNGIDAIQKYKEIIPHLVLMDVRMPMIDGYDAFFKINQFDNKAKVILITAYAQDDEKHLKAKSLGLIGTISKPYSIEQLEDVISKNI
jgi:two-component system chemotaxis response regulator CheY